MSKRTIALAAVLLVGSIGAASAQGQMQGQMQTPGSGQVQSALPPGHPPVAGSMPVDQQQAPAVAPTGSAATGSAPLYHQPVQAPAVVPFGSHVEKPMINPSAAGTLTEWRSPANDHSGNWGKREHSGSIGPDGIR